MKETFVGILAISWIGFYIFWMISASRAKRTVRSNRFHLAVRTFFIIIFLALTFGVPRFREFVTFSPGDPVFEIAGLVIFILGISLAVWARIYIGRNWGMPTSIKENPELVTDGPYRYIRHPIYSGMMLGFLGSALVGGIVWLLFGAVFGISFILSAKSEERYLAQQFPGQYPEYKYRTNAFIPFVY